MELGGGVVANLDSGGVLDEYGQFLFSHHAHALWRRSYSRPWWSEAQMERLCCGTLPERASWHRRSCWQTLWWFRLVKVVVYDE